MSEPVDLDAARTLAEELRAVHRDDIYYSTRHAIVLDLVAEMKALRGENQRLRAALAEIEEEREGYGTHWAADVARNALGDGDAPTT